MPYFVYSITGPSGRAYIGLSKNVKARWVSHRRKARIENGRHPFYDSIRRHGSEAFTVSILSEFPTLGEAQRAEVEAIAALGPAAYNVSPGGEYDAGFGGKVFWERLRKDPEAYAAYISRLRRGVTSSPNRHYPTHLNVLFAAKSAKERWKFQQRATRIARNKAGVSGEPISYGAGRDATVTPAKLKRHSIKSRENAKALWARRTVREKEDLGAAIAETLRAVYAEGTPARERLAEAARKGRENMDRVKQGQAASKGLKAFWENLKKDPEAYAAYISERRSTLMKTLKAKATP